MPLSHFEQEINKVKEELLKMGGLVEEAVDGATLALLNRDEDLCRQVIQSDVYVNEMENLIDSHCIGLIARHQPVATDLRFLATCLRIGTILERVGDQAVNIAQIGRDLIHMEPVPSYPNTLRVMSEAAKSMTRKCLDSFVHRNVQLAFEVRNQDDEVDDLNRKILEEMIFAMMQEQRLLRAGIEIILAARNLERIGDLATNIAEEVVFMVEGTVIRHHSGGREVRGPEKK